MVSKVGIIGLAAAAILLFVAGYGAGDFFYEPDACCIPPGYQPPSFNDYVAAWSGPATGIIAIVVVFLSAHLAKKREIEFRQEDRDERAIVREAYKKNMAGAALLEMQMIIDALLIVHRSLENGHSIVKAALLLPSSNRVVFNMISGQLDIMDERYVRAVATFEQRVQAGFSDISKAVLAENQDVELFKKQIIGLIFIFVCYIEIWWFDEASDENRLKLFKTISKQPIPDDLEKLLAEKVTDERGPAGIW